MAHKARKTVHKLKKDRVNMQNRIKIGTDSTADIPASLREELGIAVLPLTIIAEDREYRDGYDITPQDFYPLLDAGDRLPMSAQVNPYQYTELFEQSLKDGYTDLIQITLNSKGSSTWQSAMQAREIFYEEHPEAKENFRIHIIDSLNYSMGYGWAAIEAARRARDGASVEEIIAGIRDWIDNVRVAAVPLNLKCVRKSGRISAAAALIGDAVGIKPVITFEGGEVKTLSKIRGRKKAVSALIELCRAERKPGTPYVLARAADGEEADRLMQAAQGELDRPPELMFYLGCIISINIGPESIGIIYRKK